MTEADLFQQSAQAAIRWSSSKSASTDERRALPNPACRYAQRAPLSEGHMSFDLLWTIPARNAASLTIDQLTICTARGAKMPSEVRRRLLRHRHLPSIGLSDDKTIGMKP